MGCWSCEPIETTGTDLVSGSYGAILDEATMMSRYGFPLSWIELASVFLVFGLSSGCGDRGAALPAVNPAVAQTIRLTSTAFTEGGTIPREFTCDGADKSPPLQWSGVPQTARSLVLIVDDPDAPMGTWSHWVVYDLDPGVTTLDVAVAAEPVVTIESKTADQQPKPTLSQGKNDFGKIGYGGPCPPGGAHRYVFRLFALDQRTTLAPGANRSAVFKAIEGHIVAACELMGKYSRSP